ncbi:MAG TPA: hypothetical protein VLV49_02090 [Terriglobales bacterium]|nr:hypothetical protein [Terriglobales bacterium]
MRILRIACGIAVLLTSLHLVHGLHHFLIHADGMNRLALWAGASLGAIVIVLAFTGGILLLSRRG